eukprot:TRINITY_DN1805_c0_g1_i1.p1 TRINITY_DN1805_c0_g1~~TRINITY_DN1805_c0_g1_i1.p1  ORF type:complete len:255 (-),score=34.14 TRINITY_DN1805_c0_g1_i1:423-1187(-)
MRDKDAEAFARVFAELRNYQDDIDGDEEVHRISCALLVCREIFRKEDQQTPSFLFAVWMHAHDFVHLVNTSLYTEFSNLENLYQAAGASNAEWFARWPAMNGTTAAECDRLISLARDNLPLFPRKLREAAGMCQEKLDAMKFCCTTYDMGMCEKRGSSRSERWQRRRVLVERGMLTYRSSSSEKGWTYLHNARTAVASNCPEADRGYCVDLYVEQPVLRVYLLSFEKEAERETFMYLIDAHRRFCKDWPDALAK